MAGTTPIPANTTDTASRTEPSAARKAGIAAFIGTTVEWYDFYVYGSASALVLGKAFFPSLSPAAGTLASFATFGIGFLARPLGGVLFGHLGDRLGRKQALVTTLLLMGFATMAVGLLPTYAQIGIAAPILLTVLRLLQGVAVGGEWGGAVLIATEHAPPGKRILYGAFAQQGSPAGNLLATLAFLAATQLPDREFLSWGWRVPFLVSAVMVVIGLVIRLRLTETPEMAAMLDGGTVDRLPIRTVLRTGPVLMLLGVGATTIGVTATYIKTTFALSWATHTLHFHKSSFLTVITIALVVQLIAQPFGAVLATKWDPRRVVVAILLPEIVLLPLMFQLIGTRSFGLAALGMALATIPHVMYYGALAGILAQAYPASVRYTGISLSYQLSTALFAGTAPMLCQYLFSSTGSISSISVLGIAQVLLTIVCALALLRRSARKDA